MNGLLRLVGRRYPMLFLGVPGILSLVVGLAVGALVSVRILATELVPVGTLLIGVSLCLAGLMCILTSAVLGTVDGLHARFQAARGAPVRRTVAPPAPLSEGSESNWAPVLLILLGLLVLLVGLLWGARAVYGTYVPGGWLPGTENEYWQGGWFPASYTGAVSLCLAGLALILSSLVIHAVQDVGQEP